MLQRFGGLVVAGLIALALGMTTAAPQAAGRPAEDGYELWTDCHELPDSFAFLPIYLGTDPQGFVDLGRNEQAQAFGLNTFRALQYTRDKDFGQVPIKAGRWYGGMGAERWPPHTIDPGQLFQHFRVTTWVVDGTSYSIDPSCVLTLETDELSLGLYNVWVRFTEPGVHTLKIIGRQFVPFPFTDPLIATGGVDPLGLGGRRIFVKGEERGDVMDGQFVHSYELQVGREGH